MENQNFPKSKHLCTQIAILNVILQIKHKKLQRKKKL